MSDVSQTVKLVKLNMACTRKKTETVNMQQ